MADDIEARLELVGRLPAVGMEIKSLPVLEEEAVSAVIDLHAADEVAEHVEVDIDADDGDELALDVDGHDVADHADTIIVIDVRCRPQGPLLTQGLIIPVRPARVSFTIGHDGGNGLGHKIMTRILAGIPEAVRPVGQVFIVMEVIALDAVDAGGCIIKRPSDHSFQPISFGFITQVLGIFDFMLDGMADIVDDVFGLHENRIQCRTDVDGPASEGLGGDFRLAAVDEEDAEAAEDQGQRQGDAADDGQKAGPYSLHHERVPPLCS